MSEQERTEQATPKRREDARKRGEVARSQDVVAAAALLAGVLCFAASAKSSGIFAGACMTNALSGGFAVNAADFDLGQALAGAVYAALGRLVALVLAVAAAALASNWLQSGFLFLPNKLAPDFNRVNPVKNLPRIFSWTSLAQTAFGLVKYAVIFGLVALALRRDAETLASLPALTAGQIVVFADRFLFRLAWQFCGALVILAAIDYAARRWKYERDLRMTQRELRDEQKEESGDPATKGRLREARKSALSAAGAISAMKAPQPVGRFRREPEKKEEKSRPDRDRKR